MVLERFVSFFGLFFLIGLAWLMSSRRDHFPWRVVAWGVVLQFVFAALIFYTWLGEVFFVWLDQAFLAVVGCTKSGVALLFGRSAVESGSPMNNFAFTGLPIIIFFSALMSVLYYFGVMQWIVRGMAVGMQKTLRTSGAETLSAAANIFVGQTEAPLMIRPYLERMTRSELMAVMVGGFATVAGSVMAVYVTQFGVNAGHLLTASVISAPAGLLIAKVMQPEVDQPQTLGTMLIDTPSEATNAIHAAAEGAADGVKLAINVAAMIIAFLALIALADLLLEQLGHGVAWVSANWFSKPVEVHWSLTALVGYLFYPLAWLMGVESGDCPRVGELLAIRTVGNEFLAYEQMHQWLPAEGERLLSPRSEMIVTYALCGFANLGSIGVQIGGIGALAPGRRAELAQLGMRAMIGGILASHMTACVAGVLR
jgi:CNT family concentrative nucleoside transporter